MTTPRAHPALRPARIFPVPGKIKGLHNGTFVSGRNAASRKFWPAGVFHPVGADTGPGSSLLAAFF
jgi:hypothetical protein